MVGTVVNGSEYGAVSLPVPTPTASTCTTATALDAKRPTRPASVTATALLIVSMTVSGVATSAMVTVAVPLDSVSVIQ